MIEARIQRLVIQLRTSSLVGFILLMVIWRGNCTNTSMAGECRPSQIYKEMTLKGGINAGTYKDVGGVNTMEVCQNKCCTFPACDLAFMLAGSCYLVGCKDKKQCAMQPAKESTFKPMISYVTRWNNEGVKHTVLPSKENHYKCPTMNAINKVTLKGGLQAGDFTDIGRVPSITECYNTCCQQERCDLAFMLGQNCFTVVCKEKRLCVTTPAQPSIFNPQIAYVTKRGIMSTKKETIPQPPNTTNINTACPNTRVFENMTLKGGVDAGAYKDHGKVEDMILCRRICCEMTECHLAFMLGTNCFSVKCANVDACRAQRAKPSAYSPKISYLRKVGTNQMLPNQPLTPPNGTLAALALKQTTQPVAATTSAPPPRPPPPPPPSPPPSPQGSMITANQLNNALNLSIAQNTINTNNLATSSTSSPPLQILLQKQASSTITEAASTSPTTATATTTKTPAPVTTTTTTAMPTITTSLATIATTMAQSASQDLLNALEQVSPPSQANAKTENGTSRNVPNTCKPGAIQYNVTLKGGRNSGEFIEQKGTKNMKECTQRCCADNEKKCNLAFMLGNACYSVRCSKPDLCKKIKAPLTKFNPVIQYVRGLDDSNANPLSATPPAVETTPAETSTITTTETPLDTGTCRSQPIVHGKSIRGGKKAGKFKIFRAIKDLNTCIGKCCALKDDCDVAYMEDDKCYSIQCFKKSACTAIPLRDTDVNPAFAYMDHFLDKVDEEESEKDVTTELDQQNDLSSCGNIEIATNKTLKGGTRAGRFHPLGKKTMKSCISNCCGRSNCDIAYLLNGHCYSVECTDTKLCQATSEPAKAGDDVQLAYMNKLGVADKQRDYMAVYVIIASLVVACVAGGLIWAAYAYKKRQRTNETYKNLLQPEDEEETIDNIMHKKPTSRRHRQPRRY